MTTSYNAVAILDHASPLSEDVADELLDRLAGHSPALGFVGGVEATVTFLAEDLDDALAAGLKLLRSAADGVNLRIVGIEVLPTAEFDRRLGLSPAPEMVSVTEAAELLGVSTARVRQLVAEGKLAAEKVGNAWTVYRAAVDARKEAQERELYAHA